MKDIQYYLGLGEAELVDGVTVECSNGSITKYGDEVYVSRAMLTDCTTCKHYNFELLLPCAVNPTYTGKYYCKHYVPIDNRD